MAGCWNCRCTPVSRGCCGSEANPRAWPRQGEHWVDYAGVLDGETLGIAIFDHPENPRHPTPWHSRDYGLFAANPFGESEFLREKTRRPGFDLAANETIRFRYRVIIHPGRHSEPGPERHVPEVPEEPAEVVSGAAAARRPPAAGLLRGRPAQRSWAPECQRNLPRSV